MSFRTFTVMLLVALVHTSMRSNLLAQTQDIKLPSALIGANTALDGADQRKLDEFANFWIQQMLNSLDPQVSDARDKLVSPLNHPSAGKVFKSAYSSTLIHLLPQLLASDRMLVRFNAMLCVASLEDKAAIDLIDPGPEDNKGLSDTNPAIRYLAAQSAGKLGKKLDDADQLRILAMLQLRFINESDQVVVEQLLGSMSQLTISQARPAMLKALNMHVDVHNRNPTITLKADRDALVALLTELVTEHTNGKAIDFAIRKQFAIVACRFMVHCASALAGEDVHKSLEPQYTSMIENCEKILRWISTRPMGMKDEVLPQNDVQPNIRASKWDVLHLRATEWSAILQAPPYNTSQNDLAIPQKNN